MASPYTQTSGPGSATTAATVTGPDPTMGPRVERSLGRRPALPGGRALVGAALVVAAAVMTYAAYLSTTNKPVSSYVVAAHALRVNDRLSAADLKVVPGDLPREVANQAFGSMADLDGAVVLAPVGENALVPRTAVLARDARADNPSADFEISFTSPNWKLGGDRLLRPGELIDLYPIDDGREAGRPASLVRGVRVVSLAASGGSGGLGSGSNESVVTVGAADPTSYQAIVNVVRGQFWVIRSTRAPGAESFSTAPVTTTAGPGVTTTSPTGIAPGLAPLVPPASTERPGPTAKRP
jgi:hypothetical protein